MCLALIVVISFWLQNETLPGIRGIVSKPCGLRRVASSLERVNWTYDKIKLGVEQGSTISRKLRLPLHWQNIQSTTDEVITYSKKLANSVRWLMGVTDAARLAAVTFGNLSGRSPACICKQAPTSPPPAAYTLNPGKEYFKRILQQHLWHVASSTGPRAKFRFRHVLSAGRCFFRF